MGISARFWTMDKDCTTSIMTTGKECFIILMMNFVKGMRLISKDVIIILGNGFSIDLMNILKKDKVNLSNLFRNGDKVPWPVDGIPGFLSQKHCPELWKLGARPNIENDMANKIVEDIITCANVSAITNDPSIYNESKNVYIRAYHELVIYLKYLFIFYNQQVKDEELKGIINNWGWSNAIKNIHANTGISTVTFITYNYDIYLERLLMQMGIEYQMVGFSNTNQRFRIVKPHGSISFKPVREYERDSFSISYNRDSLGGRLEDFLVDDNIDLNTFSNINTMIPPSGESERYKLSWSSSLRKKAKEIVMQSHAEDDVFFGGLSYCGVDRRELDEILTNLNKGVNIHIVNPDSNNTFGAVITSLFNNYIHYTDSEIIGGLYNA